MEYRLISIQGMILLILLIVYLFIGTPVITETGLESKEAGKLLMGDLDVSLVAKIDLEKRDQTLTLKKGTHKKWFVSTSFQSPIKEGWVDEKLLGFLRSLKKGYVRTTDPKEYPPLGIGTSRSTTLTLRAEGGKVLKKIEIGDYNSKDKTRYVKLEGTDDVREIPEIPEGEQSKFRGFFKEGVLSINLDRSYWIETKVFPETPKIKRLQLSWKGDNISLLNKERDPKKNLLTEEKTAGIQKKDTHFWITQQTRRVRLGNTNMVMDRVVNSYLANQNRVKELLGQVKKLKGSDLVEPLRLKKTEASLSIQEKARYGFHNPELVLQVGLEKGKQETIIFGKRGQNIYFYTTSSTQKENLISDDTFDYINVYKWNQDESLHLKKFQKRYKEFKSWDKTELLLPGLEESSIERIELSKKNRQKAHPHKKGAKEEHQKRGKESFSINLAKFKLHQKVWVLEGKNIPLDQHQVKQMMDTLKNLKVGEWVGEWEAKGFKEKYGFDENFEIKLYPKKGDPIVINIGKIEGTSTFINISNHGKYSKDIFHSPFRASFSADEKTWYDFRLFSYQDIDSVKKVILEFPKKVLFLIPKKRKEKEEPTANEKASGIKKNDRRHLLVQEFDREAYSPYDPLKLPYKEYIAKRDTARQFFSILQNQKASRLIKSVWDRVIEDWEFQDYNILKYSLRLKIRLVKRPGEDVFDLSRKNNHSYAFASLGLPYSRILEIPPHTMKVLSAFPNAARPDGKFIETKQPVIPDKKEPVKKEPVKKEPVKKEPVKKEPVKKEPVKKEPVKKEPVKKEPVKKEPVKKEEPKKEPAKKEEPKK